MIEIYPRLKTVLIRPGTILGLFDVHRFAMPGGSPVGTWTVPTIPDLPADARAVAVDYDYRYGSFALTFEHESFEPVAPGQMIPTVDLRIEQVTIPVARV